MILRSAVRAACVIVSAAALAPNLVSAQSSPRSTRSGNELEEIIVTGSKLVRPDAQAPIPVTSINAEDIQVSGVTLISDYLRELPVFGINAGRTTETSGADSAKPLSTAGTERLNLRDLGVDRTLVVVDGRRHVGSTAGSTAVDVAFDSDGADRARRDQHRRRLHRVRCRRHRRRRQLHHEEELRRRAGRHQIRRLGPGRRREHVHRADRRRATLPKTAATRCSALRTTTSAASWATSASTSPTAGASSPTCSTRVPMTASRRRSCAADTRFTNLLNHQGSSFGLIDGSHLIFNDDSTSRPFIYWRSRQQRRRVSVVGGDGLDPVVNANVATPLSASPSSAASTTR